MVKLDPDDIRENVEVNVNCSFWELMRKSSIAFNLKINEMVIMTKTGALGDEMYD